ncbi:MAG TPA: ATP-binding cassette domain-containing protein, partial [Candidatus Sumerlaeota bacterium]|nr:ATP-binding cassette domain-containing protein [Candidatus Sumerlaeota bacterium]
MFVELQNLSVDFGKRRILNNISTAFTGKSVGLLGPNGAGKSTLIKSLLGFVKPAEGTARIMGFDVRREAMKIRQLVGYMPEHEAYIGDMSAVRLLR